MSGSGDSFGEDIVTLEDVRQLESTDYLCEYTGVLADTGEQVHIITLAPELADVDAAVDAFRQVSDQWYNASANANIRTIRGRGTDPRPWVALPDDNAETLATIQPDLSPDDIETVIAETAEALRTLGLYNTVHGHLSPDDIYLTDVNGDPEQLPVEVGGFGLEATVRAAVGEADPTAYTAPELLDGSNQPTEQTDVYGLGAVSYFALTGQAPVSGADLDRAVTDGPSSPPSVYDNAIPAELDDVVMQALSPSPKDRYDSPYAFGRAFLSTFNADDFRPDDTGQDSEDEAETTDSAESDGAVPTEDDDEPPSDEDDSVDSADTDETSVTRRAAVGLLGVGILGGGGWYLSREQRTAANPTDQTITPVSPAGPTASISVTPEQPSANEDVTFSAADSTTEGGVSLDTYEWAVGSDAEFSVGDETLTQSFSESGERTVRLRITDSQDRTAAATTTVTVAPLADGAPMFQYDAANTGTNSDETGPGAPITDQWAFQTGGSVSSSPAVVNGTVYVGSADNNVYALSAADGTEQWRVQIDGTISSSPAVVNGTVYIGTKVGGSVHALSVADGSQQWQFETDDWVQSSPAVVDGTVYIGSSDGNMYALSAADGSEQWRFETDGQVQSSPAVVDGTVYIGSSDGNMYALSAADGSEQWRFDTDEIVESSPAVVDGTVYVGDVNHILYALSTADGTEQWRFGIAGGVESAPAVIDDTVYVAGISTVYALSTADGTEQWRFQTEGPVISSPAVIEGTVYVGSGDLNEGGHVYALSAADGSELGSFQTGSVVRSSPAVVDGTVYVGSGDNNVYALSEQ